MGQLQYISHTHDQIIDWLLANPNLPQSICAAHFGYTEPWLSTLIHSDLFQAKLQERQAIIFGEVAASVKDRITALAHDSLKKLHEKVSTMENPEHLIGTSELALKALGFGGQLGRPGVQINHFNGGQTTNVVTKDVLAEARSRMQQKTLPPVEDAVVIPLAIGSALRIDE